MKPPARATAKHFQQEVAGHLKLPPGSGEAEIRKALGAKGPDFVSWYDTRLRAIAESIEIEQRSARRFDLITEIISMLDFARHLDRADIHLHAHVEALSKTTGRIVADIVAHSC